MKQCAGCPFKMLQEGKDVEYIKGYIEAIDRMGKGKKVATCHTTTPDKKWASEESEMCYGHMKHLENKE